MNLENLNRKWHGVPVWAWAAITLIVLYLGYRMLKHRGSGGSSNSSPLAVAEPLRT